MKTAESDSEDDFEVVSDPGDDQFSNAADNSDSLEVVETEAEKIEVPSTGSQETLKTIENVQKGIIEHITQQHEVMVNRLDRLENIRDKGIEENLHLRGQVERLTLELQAKCVLLEDRQNDAELLKRYMEKVDELTAQRVQDMDTIRNQAEIIRQCSADNNHVPTAPDSDSFVCAERDATIAELRREIEDWQASLEQKRKEASQTVLKNEELNHLVSALRAQIEQDAIDVRELRQAQTREVEALQREIEALRNTPVKQLSASGGSAPLIDLTASQTSEGAEFACPLCFVGLLDQAALNSHVPQCPHWKIDNID